MQVKRDKVVVLVADDNTFIRFLVRKWLGPEALVVEAGNGLEVLDAYKTHHPDILFLDIHLPGRNGLEILPDIMAFDPAAHVIMLSADSMKDNIVESVRDGAKAFITKPFTRDTLYKYYVTCPAVRVVRATRALAGESGY